MDLTSMCRVCLLTEDTVDLLDWHQPIDPEEHILSVKECFCECTRINLSLKEADDGRTQYLCLCCAQSLKDAYDFIEKAKMADKKLRSRQIDKTFEWVAVKAEDVDGMTETNNQSLSEAEIETSNNTDEEEIAYEQIENQGDIQILEELTKANYNEEFMDYTRLDSQDDSEHVNSSDKRLEKSRTKKVKRGSTLTASKRKAISGEEIVICEICRKPVKRKSLKIHQSRHTKPKTFLCQACPKVFVDINSLKNHESIHEENRERYPCEKCDRTFLTQPNYKRHLQTHDATRKLMYPCTQCEKSYTAKSGLLKHQLRHNGPKLKCNFCDKQYVSKSDLKFHIKTHSEPPVFCNLCDKSYANQRDLNRHIQLHEGFFRYTCKTCGEEFSKYDRYYKHRQLHTGFAYRCDICETQFTNSYRCKRHIRGVHKVFEESEVGRLAVKMNETREHRGQICEFMKHPDNK